MQSPVNTEKPPSPTPLKTETPDIEVKDEIEEKLEAMEKGIEEPEKVEKAEVNEDEGKVKEDFNAADPATSSASEYAAADEKVRVEYIPQGKLISRKSREIVIFFVKKSSKQSFKNFSPF